MRSWRMTAVAAALATVAGSAHAISLARMATPPELASAERAKISGVGFGWKDKIEVAGHKGVLDRSSSRTRMLDGLFDSRKSTTRFTLSGPLLVAEVEATCGMRKRSLNFGPVEVGSVALTYQCDYKEGGAPLAATSLEIVESERFRGLLAQNERKGRAAFGDVAFEIASVDKMQGSPVPLGRPIGYLFTRDGKAIGAVELNGSPSVLFGPGLTDPERRAVLLAAVSLGLFADPAGAPD